MPPFVTPSLIAADTSLWSLLEAGGAIGLLILLLSIAAVALVVEHLMTIRAPLLMPPSLAEEVEQLLRSAQPVAAIEYCRRRPSVLSYVIEAGLAEVDGGWPSVEKAMEDAVADQSARLLRKIEYLSLIGNIAPMLGLLGTVMGMIFAFGEVADTQGAARAADLAEGIYLALVTTVEGLIVAIPSLGAFAIFRNRVDQLVAEVAQSAQHAMRPLKRLRVATRSARSKAAAPSPPPSAPAGPPRPSG
ncbi:MAG: MotA/TolQ/ExbB proton channel family protein [Pirellulales bacterium]